MAKIDALNMDSLGYDELYEFMHDISSKLTSSFESVPENAKSYIDAVEELDKAWAEDKDNALIAADAAADMAWKDFDAFLNGIVNYPVAKISAAAAEVKFIFDQFDDPTDLPYVEEYAVLEKLLSALEAISADVRKDSMVDPLIEQLKQRWTEFTDLFKMYEKTDELQKFVAIKEAKAKVTKEYKDLVDSYNASLQLQTSEALEEFALQVNDIISKPISRANVKARTRKLS